MLRRHFKGHCILFKVEDESIFPRHVDNRTATPSIDGIFLIEHTIEEEPVFRHLRVIGQTKSRAKEGVLIMEVEVGVGLIVVADKAGAHFWRILEL